MNASSTSNPGDQRIAIRGRYVLADPSEPTLLTDGVVVIEGGSVVWVGAAGSMPPGEVSYTRSFDLVMPGFINSHHHTYARPPARAGSPDGPLEWWIVSLNALPAAGGPRLGALASSIRQLRAGVTSVLHSDGPGSAADYESAARDRLSAYGQTGQRVAFALSYIDQYSWVYAPDGEFLDRLPEPARSELVSHSARSAGLSTDRWAEMFVRVSRWLQDASPSGLLRAFVGPLSPIWASQTALEMMAQLLRDGAPGLHTHFVESIHQRQFAEHTFKSSMAEYLARLDLLDERTSLAHGVWVSDADLRVLAETGATIVHNAASNLRLRCGIAPVLDMLDRGVNVALGQDSDSLDDDDDFLRDARLAWKLHFRPGVGGVDLTPEGVFRIMMRGGARAMRLEGKVGQLVPGSHADLVGLSLERTGEPNRADGHGLATHVLQFMRSEDVRWVMVDGVEVLRDGRCLLVDEEAVDEEIAEAIAAAPAGAWPERLIDEVQGQVRAFYSQPPWRVQPESLTPYYELNGA